MKHLRSLMQKVAKGQAGFTLIELLIVILILGIIAAVVILNVGGFIGMGEKEAFCTEGDTVQAAAMAYAVEVGGGNCSALVVGNWTETLVDNEFLTRPPKYAKFWNIAPNCYVSGNVTLTGDDGNETHYPTDCG